MFKCKFQRSLGAIHDRDREGSFTVAAWRKEEFPQGIHIYTQKGNPEVFDRHYLFRKVNADSEMTGRL